MNARALGYVVIEWNQASRCPEVWDGFFLDRDRAAAQYAADEARKDALGRGRDEHYTVALVEDEEA